jgi:tetratricopeptide (TPR) repeat protein
MMIKKSRLFVASVLLIGLAGCATPEPEVSSQPVVTPTPTLVPTPVPALTPQPVVPVVNEASVLKEGIALYNNGDYNGAIKRLTSANEIWGAAGSRLVQLEALKYSAFSYCVSGRQAQCRQQFEKALKLDIDFDLAAGEKGHPLWGPVFSKAQKAALKAAGKTKK